MDILHDNSYRVLASIADAVGVDGMPDYVANREIIDKKQAETLDDMDFADPAARLYPITTKEAVWMSAAYFEYTKPEVETSKQAAISDYVEKRIRKAANLFGILGDVDAAISKIKQSKEASDLESDYALPEKKRYRVTSPEELKVASEYFNENRASYPSDIRTRISEFLVKKAFAYGVDTDLLPSSVLKEAGLGMPDRELLMTEINERMKVANDPSCALLLGNVNLLLQSEEGCDLGKNLEKVASILRDFDAIEGLDRQYGKKVTYPADILCSQPMDKVASECGRGIVLGSIVLDSEKLASVMDKDLLHDSMGEKFAEACLVDGNIDATKLKSAVDALDDGSKLYFRSVVGLLCD